MSINQKGQNVKWNDQPIVMPDKMLITLGNVADFLSNLEGKILTISDASIPDEKQNNAVKSIIRNTVWEQFDVVREWYYKQSDNGKTPFPFGQVTIR